MKPTWQSECGRVKLWLGDALEVMPTWTPGSVDMIWTDPPFGHGNQDGDLQAARVRDGVKGSRVAECVPIMNDTGEGFERTLKGFLDQAAIVLNRDCSAAAAAWRVVVLM